MNPHEISAGWKEGYKRLAEFLLPHLPGEGKILELGCGRGQLTGFLTRRGYSLFGTDIDHEVLKELGQNHSIGVLCADFSSGLPIRPETLDLILSNFTLGWLDRRQVRGTFKECFRILKEDGAMLHSDFLPVAANPAQEIAIEQGLPENNRNPSRRWWTPKELEDLAKEAGFGRMETLYFDWKRRYGLQEALHQLRRWDATEEFMERRRADLERRGMELPKSFILICRK